MLGSKSVFGASELTDTIVKTYMTYDVLVGLL